MAASSIMYCTKVWCLSVGIVLYSCHQSTKGLPVACLLPCLRSKSLPAHHLLPQHPSVDE